MANCFKPMAMAGLAAAGLLLAAGDGNGADPAEGYRAVAARVAADAHPHAAILLIGPGQQAAFARHHRGPAPVFPMPAGQTHPASVRLQMAELTRPYERLYVVYTPEARQADPQNAIERYLDVYTFRTADERVAGVRYAVYEVGFKTPVVAVTRDARFAGRDGETITLVEHSTWPATARPGAVAHAGLVWASDRTPLRRYEVVMALRDSAGRVVAERAAEPEGGWRPTTEWKPVVWVVDGSGVQLPRDLPAGGYTLWLGLRDAAEPAVRLPVEGGDGIAIGEVMVQ